MLPCFADIKSLAAAVSEVMDRLVNDDKYAEGESQGAGGRWAAMAAEEELETPRLTMCLLAMYLPERAKSCLAELRAELG